MLSMTGHIDSTFQTGRGYRYQQSGERGSDGKWIDGLEKRTPHRVTLQPLSDQEISNLGVGGDRIEDYRKIYVNDGDLYQLTSKDEWQFAGLGLDGIRFTVYSMDNRPWRGYCKCVVHRNDR